MTKNSGVTKKAKLDGRTKPGKSANNKIGEQKVLKQKFAKSLSTKKK